MSRNLFFYSNIETDLIINSSIALIVRKLKRNYKTILIHPKSERLSHKSIVNYYQFFDEVKCINFFDIPSHAAGFFKGIKMILSAKKEIQKIYPDDQAINYKLNDIRGAFVVYKNIKD